MALILDGTSGISASGNIYGNNIIVTNTLTAGSFSPTVLSVTGNVTGANIATTGIVSATGNVTGGNILTAGLISAAGNITSGNISATTYTGTTVSVTGNVTSSNLVTSGLVSATGNITGGNIAATNHTGTTVSVTGNINGGNVISSALMQGVTVSASGNVVGGNVTTAGLVSATGNVVGGNVTTAGLVSATGNVTGGNLITAGLISATGNITGGNIAATNHTGTTVSVTGTITGGNLATGGTASATGNITGGNLITTGLVTATGNITGGNLITAGLISATGNITGGNIAATNHTGTTVSVTGNVIGGNLTTVGQLVSSVATGTAPLVVTSTTKVTNLNVEQVDGYHADTANTVSTIVVRDAAANITAAYFNGVGISVSGNIAGGNVITAGAVSVTGSGSFGAGLNVTGNLTVSGNLNYQNVTDLVVGDPLIYVAANNTSNLIDIGIVGSANVSSVYQHLGLVRDHNDNTWKLFSNVVAEPTTVIDWANAIYAPLNTGAFYANSTISALGNITGANFVTAGGFYDTGDALITSTATNANVTLTPTGTGIVQTSKAFSATGNIVGGNITTAGLISATGAITGAALTGTSLSVSTGNVTAGNLVISGGIFDSTQLDIQTTAVNANIVLTPNGTGNVNIGRMSASGNITAAAYYGSGAGLTSIPGANVTGTVPSATSATSATTAGTVTTAAQGNITSVGTLTSLSVTGNISTSTGLVGTLYTNSIINTGANLTGNIGSATLYFNTAFVKATSAQYADLAENYEADAEYAPGTVLAFGGDKEVTVANEVGSTRVAGVVSTNPAYLMNSGLETAHIATVALTGRVPTSVVGNVSKGDMMIAGGNGVAIACATPSVGTVIGKALQNYNSDQPGVIEVVVGRV